MMIMVLLRARFQFSNHFFGFFPYPKPKKIFRTQSDRMTHIDDTVNEHIRDFWYLFDVFISQNQLVNFHFYDPRARVCEF